MIGPPGGPSGDVELPGGGSIAFGLGGCLGGARDQLYGDVQGFLETSIFIGNLLTPVQERVIEDDEFRSALGAWRRCMAEAGYPGLERSSDATQLARAAWEVDPGTAKEREVEIAVATATCARETELVATGERRESEVWAEVLEEHAGVIAAYEELRGPALDRAQDILEAP